MTTQRDAFPVANVAIAFQPIIDLDARTVVACEALARFDDGASPTQHLNRAEVEGAREELELALIEQAVRASAALPPDLRMAVNASGSTILRHELDSILGSLSRPWAVELYEGRTDAYLPSIRERVQALGGELYVDDAGSACADETRIAALRPDVVKIDKALFWASASGGDAEERLLSLAEAARSCGARMLIEGVSRPEHVTTALALGATLGQGFYFGKPTLAAHIRELLSDLRRSVGIDTSRL